MATRNRLFSLFFLGLCFISTQLQAGQVFTESVSVTEVWSHSGNHIINTSSTANPCGTAGVFWWPISDENADHMFTLALTSFSGGHPLRIAYYDDASSDCWSGGVRGYKVYISQ